MSMVDQGAALVSLQSSRVTRGAGAFGAAWHYPHSALLQTELKRMAVSKPTEIGVIWKASCRTALMARVKKLLIAFTAKSNSA